MPPFRPRSVGYSYRLRLAVCVVLVFVVAALLLSDPVPVRRLAVTLPSHPIRAHGQFTHSYLLDHLNETEGKWRLYPREAVNSSPLCSDPAGCEWIPHQYGAVVGDVLQMLVSSDPLVLFPNGSQLTRLVALPTPLTSVVSPASCWAKSNTSILFLGHSHVRYLASLMCMMLGGRNCNLIGSKGTKVAVMEGGPRGGPVLAFIQSSYFPKRRMGLLRRALRKRGVMEDNIFGHIVYGRGAWDMAYRDVDPVNLTASMVDALDAFAREFGGCRVRAEEGWCSKGAHLTLVPNHRHYNFGSSNKPAISTKHAVTCKNVRRQWIFHEAARCAASLYTGHEPTLSQIVGGSVPATPFANATVGIFDVWNITSSSFGRATVDLAGHHYLDITLEGMLQLLFAQHLCPAAAVPRVPSVPPSACQLVSRESRGFQPVPLCSCHGDEFRDTPECLSLRPYIGGRRD